jgi:hypothetical protein
MLKLWQNKKATSSFYKAMKEFDLTPENSEKACSLWNQQKDGSHHVVNKILWGWIANKVKDALDIEQGDGINWKYIKWITTNENGGFPWYCWLKTPFVLVYKATPILYKALKQGWAKGD